MMTKLRSAVRKAAPACPCHTHTEPAPSPVPAPSQEAPHPLPLWICALALLCPEGQLQDFNCLQNDPLDPGPQSTELNASPCSSEHLQPQFIFLKARCSLHVQMPRPPGTGPASQLLSPPCRLLSNQGPGHPGPTTQPCTLHLTACHSESSSHPGLGRPCEGAA